MFVLNEHSSIANNFLAQIRGVDTQKDGMRFRRNLERLGEIMAYEVSKEIRSTSKLIETPLGNSNVELIDEPPVLISIMRAGLPYFQGFLNYFDDASCGFIGAGRKNEGSANEIEIDMNYSAMPSVEGKTVVLIDPMLASGKSMIKTIENIYELGTPAHVFIASVVASKEGLEFVNKHVKFNFSIWTCAVDEHLNNMAYIVPGLGDAGDLAFGLKI